ncbi:MAG TPA: DNA topology modulation protein [Longimicrobium sp.]|nr:DNA topology modulation protein [Longimicrobium sp.]
MRRVLVIGSGGAGKSTFAARLAARTGLPLVHLDALFWRPGWVQTPKEEWARVVDGIAARDRWIMDGNYSGTLDRRLAACDTVVFLDFPRAVCLWRVVKRRVRFHRRSRPDVPEGCDEKLDLEFLRWIWNYPRNRRPGVLTKLAALRPDQRAVVLRSDAEVEAFLASVPEAEPEPEGPPGTTTLERYVFQHYPHLMTERERAVHRHLTALFEANGAPPPPGLTYDPEEMERKASRHWISRDPEVIVEAREGWDAFRARVARRILRDHPAEVYLNHCPACGALTWTPTARLCLVCGHTWFHLPRDRRM